MTARSTEPSDPPNDRLYAEPEGRPTPFNFDERVAAVFEDMVRRSVPGYRTIVETTGVFAARHLMPQSRAYDLGCSLGAGMLAMLDAAANVDFELVGVDSSAAMIARCRELLASELAEGKVALLQEDVRTVEVSRASFVAMNFTLQFIPPAERLPLLEKVHRGMLPGGALMLSEKLSHESPEAGEYFAALHEDFKRLQGYSELEIAKKRAALERVLVPESLEVHHERLAQAGFRTSRTWFHCMNFASVVAYV